MVEAVLLCQKSGHRYILHSDNMMGGLMGPQHASALLRYQRGGGDAGVGASGARGCARSDGGGVNGRRRNILDWWYSLVFLRLCCSLFNEPFQECYLMLLDVKSLRQKGPLLSCHKKYATLFVQGYTPAKSNKTPSNFPPQTNNGGPENWHCRGWTQDGRRTHQQTSSSTQRWIQSVRSTTWSSCGLDSRQKGGQGCFGRYCQGDWRLSKSTPRRFTLVCVMWYIMLWTLSG